MLSRHRRASLEDTPRGPHGPRSAQERSLPRRVPPHLLYMHSPATAIPSGLLSRMFAGPARRALQQRAQPGGARDLMFEVVSAPTLEPERPPHGLGVARRMVLELVSSKSSRV